MTAKEYLEQVIGIDKRINSLEHRLEMLKESAERITPMYGSISSGTRKSSDKLSENIGEKIDIEKEIITLKEEFKAFQIRVEKEIHRIPNNVYATLLAEKYINGTSWNEIAEIIGYNDVKYVRKILHSKALAEFERINPQNTRFLPCIP